MNAPNNRRTVYITLLISLLLHGAMLLLFLRTQNNKIDTKAKESLQKKIELKKNKKKLEMVETFARKSEFGAPVIFRDEPEVTPTTIDQSLQEKETFEKTNIEKKESVETKEI